MNSISIDNKSKYDIVSSMNICHLCNSLRIEFFKKTKNRKLLYCPDCRIIHVEKIKKKRLIPENKFFEEYLSFEKYFNSYFKNCLKIISRYKKGKKLLDVGCGAGMFLNQAKAKGWSVTGVEPSRKPSFFAKSRGFSIYNSIIEKAKIKPKSFDAITLFQLVEHLENPINVLKKLRSLLKKDGLLMLTTPNRNSLMGHLLGKKWFGYYNYEHLFMFDKDSLKFALEKAGFKVIKIYEDDGKSLTPSWVLTRLSDYYYNHKTFIKGLLNVSRPMWKYFDWINVREPKVDLVVIAKSN